MPTDENLLKNNVLAAEGEPRQGRESDLETMASSGVHLGSLRRHGNPKMKPYIWSSKNIFQIIFKLINRINNFLLSNFKYFR